MSNLPTDSLVEERRENTEEVLIKALIASNEAHVTANCEGHRGTQAAVRELGDRVSDDLRTYARLIVLALAIVAGLSGIKLVLPDGTSVTPVTPAAAIEP